MCQAYCDGAPAATRRWRRPILEPPKLASAAILAALHAHYGLDVQELALLPLGADSASFAYRVEGAEGASYFLRVRAGLGFCEPRLAVPHYLHGQGVPHIIAPLSSASGALWVGLHGFALSLHPFVDGRVGGDVGLSDGEWRELGLVVRRFHSLALPPGLARVMPRETFTPSRRDLLPDLEAAIDRANLTGHAEWELAAFWHSRRDLVHTVVGRCDALAAEQRQASLPLALCHADLQVWNVLLGRDGQIWLVDWDETILAPVERDLMFVIRGIGGRALKPHDTECFFQGYGDMAPDPRALTYYRYAWAVQDIAAYAAQILFLSDFGEQTRRDALRGFMSLFEPGEIVDIALTSGNTAT